MNIVVASGKGGTGKTTVAVNLAYFLAKTKKVCLFDCDVEAPNDRLFLNAKFNKSIDVNIKIPKWDESKCTNCGKCSKICKFNAICNVKNKIIVFDELCHSCLACAYVCTSGALNLIDKAIGKINVDSKTLPFYFAEGVLNIGESLAPFIIKNLKSNLDSNAINIFDASPGTSCSVVKTLEHADYLILVAEPTPFGLNDLKLISSLAKELKIPTGIIINKSSSSSDYIIENFANKKDIKILTKIAFKKTYLSSYSKGEILIDKFKELEQKFNTIYKNLSSLKPIMKEIKDTAYKLSNLKEINYLKKTKINNINKRIKEIVVISGKGGTGKTTFTAALSKIIKNKVLCDCDVDAANLHILLKPKIYNAYDFIAGKKYFIDKALCTNCGKCKSICNFNAIHCDINNNYNIDDILCEACGFCYNICPLNAIKSIDAKTGTCFESITKNGLFSHAKLNVAQENSGKLVCKVRDTAFTLASKSNAEFIISDGPPGTGCPVISSITSADLVLIVCEASISSYFDLERTLNLTKYFRVKTFIIINKADINSDICKKINILSNKYKSKVIGSIPYDAKVVKALLEKKNILSIKNSKAAKAILNIANIINEYIKKEN